MAAKGGFTIVLQILLERGADVTAKTETGETALKLAAWGGHEAVLQHLLDYLDGEPNSEAWLATSRVFDVAAAGDEKAMQLLLDKGADITAEDQHKKTALHVAASKGHVALARMLLENGANVDATDDFGQTPICKAAFDGHIEVVRLLIEHKANLEPPLFDAISPRMGRGKVEIVQLLLDNGADVSAKKKWILDTPLHTAVRQGSTQVIKLLLEYGAVVGPQNEDGQTALDISIAYGDEDVSNLLLGK